MKRSIPLSKHPVKASAPFSTVLLAGQHTFFQNKTDKEIWKAFKNGDDEAFSYIYMMYVNVLYRFGKQFLKDREMVKDCIQDLFISLRKGRSGKAADEILSIKSYLFKALHNQIQAKIKTERKYVVKQDIENKHSFQINITKELLIIREEYLNERKEVLKRTLNTLSQKQRQAVLHYFYEGFTHEETASIMGLKNKSSVRKLIYRALDALRDAMTPKKPNEKR